MTTYKPGDLALRQNGEIVIIAGQTAKQVRGQTYYSDGVPSAAAIAQVVASRHQSVYHPEDIVPYSPELHAAAKAINDEIHAADLAHYETVDALRKRRKALFTKEETA